MNLPELINNSISSVIPEQLIHCIELIVVEPDDDADYVQVVFKTKCDQSISVSFHTYHGIFIPDELETLIAKLEQCTNDQDFYEAADDLFSTNLLSKIKYTE